MTMISNLTIISKEFIKPSSPTPTHLKTYNLSLFDQISIPTFIPIVLFYPNTARSSHDKTLDLKKSLSKTLTKYYPFAGRHAKIAPNYVDCNDHGAEFLEATIDSTLTDFLQNSQHEDFDQLFPYNQVWTTSNNHGREGKSDEVIIPLAVQVNHFKCGGMAVATSLSHKVADGGSISQFLYDWGKMTKYDEFSIDPKFLYVPNINLNFDGLTLPTSKDTVTKSFIFPNSKINDLKLKVQAMTAESGQPITDPTRVEVLCWLLYKSAVAAATTNNNSRFSIPTGINHAVSIRNKMIEALPNNSIGNRYMIMKMFTNNQSEMKPEAFINDFKKQKMEFCSLRNIETALGSLSTSESDLKETQGIIDAAYFCSSLSRYPIYDVDFGWGTPLKATVAGGMMTNCFLMISTPDQDGIEVFVSLEKQEMAIVQTDPELLAYCR
ncbi:transferase, Chloramphenicol acetyltransferase-like domain protein [Artemisia annua]|uniref:Transferase, Chloramphenicol acetyltransferase-like domain protein n=1 Tax=Artemisia annua TaxID=35608 RepID=A0A2U1MJJ7_ARTAN|nr:transferase, Chloramphenicol acetyltransferase-like domain protein [Artemisia annua]